MSYSNFGKDLGPVSGVALLLVSAVAMAGDPPPDAKDLRLGPELGCSATYYNPVSAKKWENPTKLKDVVMAPADDVGHIKGEGFRLSLSRSKEPKKDHKTHGALSPTGGKDFRMYSLAATDKGCKTTPEKALKSDEVLSFEMIDDQSGKDAPPKVSRFCFIVEKTGKIDPLDADGQPKTPEDIEAERRTGYQIVCTQKHNPARDQDRENEKAAGAKEPDGKKHGSGPGL